MAAAANGAHGQSDAVPRNAVAVQVSQTADSETTNAATGEVIDSTPLPPLSDPPPPSPTDSPASESTSHEGDPQHGEEDTILGPLEPESSVETIGSEIEIEPLGQIPQKGAGLIDERQGGLGARLWQGASASLLSALLPRLPAPVSEPALRGLQLRLLLTRAPGPGDLAGVDPLVVLRAERLHAMGFEAEAASLLKALPAPGIGDPQEAFEKSLLAGEEEGACARVPSAISVSTEPYWRKALIYCQIRAGREDLANLGLDLLREGPIDGGGADLIALAELLLGQRPQAKLRLAEKPDPLRATMMKAAGLPVVEIQGVAPHRPSGVAGDALSARDTSLPVIERIAHGERAFQNGLIGTGEMAELYRLVPLAGNGTPKVDNPRARARLFVIAERAVDPSRRGAVIAQALMLARESGNFAAMAPLYAEAIERLPLGADLAFLAPDAFRVLLLAGNADLASFWLNLAEGTRLAPRTTLAVPGMEILAQWAGIAGRYDTDPVEIWRATTGANEAVAARLYAIFAALGQPIAAAGGSALVGLGPSEAREIGEAAQAGRRGETVLRALVALGDAGLASTDIASLTQAIGGLAAIGLEGDSRAIALAAGIAAGL